jgi:hypothetical protein
MKTVSILFKRTRHIESMASEVSVEDVFANPQDAQNALEKCGVPDERCKGRVTKDTFDEEIIWWLEKRKVK